MTSWNNVYTKMPEEKDCESSIPVLVWMGPGRICAAWYDLNDKEWYDFNGEMLDDVEYWADHPEEPE